MIDIKVNGQSLDLYPDTAISFEEDNPLFIRDHVPATHTLPFTIPRIGNNRIFDFVAEPDSQAKYKEAPATISFAGGLLFAGKVRVMRGDKASYKILFTTLSADYEDVELRSLDFGGMRNVLGSGANKTMPAYTAPHVYPDNDYYLAPVRNKKIELDLPAGSTTNRTAYYFFYKYDFSGGIANRQQEWFNPSPFLFSVLDKALSVETVGTFITDVEMKQLVMFNPVWIKQVRETFSAGVTNSTNFILSAHLPNKTLSELLNTLTNLFCLVIFFNRQGQLQIDMLKDLPSDDILDISDVVDGSGYTEYQKYDGYNLVHDRPSEDLAYDDILPKPDGIDFGEFERFVDLPAGSSGAFALVKYDGYYYIYDTTWKKYGYAYNDIRTESGEDVPAEASTVIMEDSLWPTTEQPYLLTTNLSDRHSFGFRFAFARGSDLDADSIPYHLLTSDNWNNRMQHNWKYSLRINNESGLAKTFWSSFLELNNNYYSVIEVLLSLPEASELDYHTQIRQDNQLYFWRNKKYTLYMSGISKTTLELVKR
jgi:hypothetical protein